MSRKAQAISHGAATIINAIATGKGAAIGVDLWTKATVTLTNEAKQIEVKIKSDSSENPILAQKTVHGILAHFGLENDFGAKVETDSNIPIARGLKSSSAAANAIALATTAALDTDLDDISLIKLGVDCALAANVTLTGAFDDACASYLGGIVITDNMKRIIIEHVELTESLAVLFYVPKEKTYTIKSNMKRMRSVISAVNIAYNQVLNGNFWSALTLNGLIYSSALGYDPSPAIDALTEGALAAGLSGTGPAFSAIVNQENVGSVKDIWQKYDGDILESRINIEKARVVN